MYVVVYVVIYVVIYVVCSYICSYLCIFVFPHPHEQNIISQKYSSLCTRIEGYRESVFSL